MGDGMRYEHKTVKAVRGTDSLVTARWEKRGWELVDEAPGRVQTVLTFRRPRPLVTRKIVGIAVLGLALVATITIGALTEGDRGHASATSVADAGDTTAPEGSTKDDTLTAENNEDFAEVMAGPVQGPKVEAFVDKYHLKKVAFVGYVEDVFNADYDEESAFIRAGKPGSPTGPRFQISEYYRSAEAAQIEKLKKGQIVRVTGTLGMYGDDYSQDTLVEETGRKMVVLVDQELHPY